MIFVDFGNSEWIINRNVFQLRAEFTQLKVQSIAVTLSNVSFSFLYYRCTDLLNR